MTAKRNKEKLDNRMCWIRNLEKLNQSEEGSYWQEYEIASECKILGKLDYENGRISCQPLMFDKDKNGMYQYLLRIQYCKIDSASHKETSSKGYYFETGILGELLSLLSVFFQCRVYHMASYSCICPDGSKVKTEENFFYKRVNKAIHPTIFDDESKPRNFADGLREFLDSIKELDNKKHQKFILACNHYARSLKDVGQDSEMVFMRLVSSIEALSKDYKLADEDDPLDGADFEVLFETATLTQQQHERLQKTLNVTGGKIKIIDKVALKFRKFISLYSQGFVYNEELISPTTYMTNDEIPTEQTKYYHVTSQNLEEVLENIYEARSKYLHEGEPMHLSLFMRGVPNSDFDITYGGAMDSRRFSHTQILPYPSVFENLVRHCLLQYLKKSQTQ